MCNRFTIYTDKLQISYILTNLTARNVNARFRIIQDLSHCSLKIVNEIGKSLLLNRFLCDLYQNRNKLKYI